MLIRLIGLAFAGVLALATPAAAQAYGDIDSAEVSDSSAAPGQVVTVSAKCFAPGSKVTFSDGNGFTEDATADASCTAAVSYTVPQGSGPITVTASGVGPDGAPLVLGVTISRSAAPALAGVADAPLARTGSDSSIELTRVGIGLLAAGSIAVYAVRRRQHATTGA